MRSIEQLRELVGLSARDEVVISPHRVHLSQELQQWQPEFSAWLREKTSWPADAPDPLLDDYFPSFISPAYDEDFHAVQYRQALHWVVNGLPSSQIIAALSQIRQFFVRHAELLQEMELARALCRVVDVSQSIQSLVTYLDHNLETLRGIAEQDIARIQRSCAISGIGSDQVVKAYIAHYRWKVRAYSLALGESVEESEAPVSSSDCVLGRWLDNGGMEMIPEPERVGLRAVHEHFHRLMEVVIDKARQRQPQHIAQFLMDVEAASEEIARILDHSLEQQVHKLVVEDSLTGLGNRRMFDKAYAKRIAHASRNGSSFGLLFIDIDNFKAINDRHGHETGDRVLREAARLLQTMMRGGDSVYRWGGEEFAALVHARSLEEVGQVAERLRARIEQSPVTLDNGAIAITVSIGATCFIPEGEDAECFFKRADRLLHEAKFAGRNRVMVA